MQRKTITMYPLIPTEGVFFVGNGRTAMGGEGADIIQLFAPCYSIPGIITLHLCEPSVTAENFRIRGSAGYITKLTETASNGSSTVGELTDYTHPTSPVFIRRFDLERPLRFQLQSPFRTVDTTNIYAGRAVSRLFELPDGTPVFSKSHTDKETYCQVLLSPGCTVEATPGGGETVTFPAGRSYLLFVGGDYGKLGKDSFPNCMKLSETMLKADLDAVLADFLAHWKKIFDEITVDRAALATIPNGDELVEAVATALITQTSAEGGVMAGAFYHLAYGRDMYGVFRGYMAMGLYRYARAMVAYMADIYRQKGYMPNASGMGMSCSHRHENDDVEQTGYYLLELCQYTAATGDSDFFRDRLDYGLYLLDVQEKQLAGGMIPFNGDETYIAGGIFPRSGIDHGSMEATALYIGSAETFLSMAEGFGLLDADFIATHRAVAAEAKASFAGNFTDGERVYINQPARVALSDHPPYRHGVCHGCMGMTWLLRAPEGGYLCAACYGKQAAPVSHDRFSTDCALWMSVFAGCSLLPAETIRNALVRSVAEARANGFGETKPENTVGYEYGVILYTLAAMGMTEGYDDVLNAVLEDRVRGAVWTEYYRGGKPSPTSCPYRPWESAINLCGILAYLHEHDQT